MNNNVNKENSRILCLDEIGIKHDTDKASRCASLPPCDYLRHYELFMSQWRYKEFTLIEFGVDKGQSLRTWCEYFPKANIVGVDIKGIDVEDERIRIIQKDVTSHELYNELEQYRGTIGIIIDDSLHAWSSQRMLFEKYFPLLNSGGYFIVEDIRCTPRGDIQFELPRNFVWDRESFTNYTKRFLELLRFPYSYRDVDENLYQGVPQDKREILLGIENIFYIPGAIAISRK